MIRKKLLNDFFTEKQTTNASDVENQWGMVRGRYIKKVKFSGNFCFLQTIN